MGKITDVRMKGETAEEADPQSHSRVLFDANKAVVFRKLCRYAGKSADEMLVAMMRLWVATNEPNLEWIETSSTAEYQRAPKRESVG